MSNTPTRLAILCAPRAQQFCEPLNQFRHLEPLAQCACGPAFHALTVDRRTGEVLGVKTGIGNLNEGRASSINLADWEGIYRELRPLEPGIEGGRIVRNLLENTNDLNADDWNKEGSNTVEYVGNGAWRLNFGASVSGLYQPLGNDYASHSMILPIEIKKDVNTGDVKLGDGNGNAEVIVPVTDNWVRYTTNVYVPIAGTGFYIHNGLRDFDNDSILISFPQAEDVSGQSNQNPGEYVSVGVGTGEEIVDIDNLPIPAIVDFGGSSGVWIAGTRTMSNTPVGSNASYPRYRFTYSAIVPGKRYEVNGQLSGDITHVSSVRLDRTTGADLDYDPSTGVISGSVVAVHDLIAFRLNATMSPTSVTIDSLSIKECKHGLGVDAVKAFATKNGNTVAANVVTEAMGDWLPELPWLVHAPGATNLIPHARDLTDASWNPMNVTVDQDAVGIDGVPNAACTLTASAGDGTVISNAVTAASGKHSTVWFIKRKAGTGKIELTLDNGAIWQDVTAQVNSGWTQIAVDQAALTNPQVGIRIVTNGDAVYVDYVACYANTVNKLAATLPPIPTSGAPVSRLDCDLSFDDENHSSEGSLDCKVQFPLASADMSGNLEILSLNGGPGLLYYDVAAGAFKSSDGTNTAEKAQVIDAGVTYKVSVRHEKGVLRVGVNDNWGTEQPYEGAFPSGSALELFRALPYVGKIRDIRMYQGDN